MTLHIFTMSRRLMECTDKQVSIKYQSQLQMLTSWLKKMEDVIDFEITGAAASTGIDIDDLQFILPLKSV